MLFRYNAVAPQQRNRGLVHQAETGNAVPAAAERILSFLRRGATIISVKKNTEPNSVRFGFSKVMMLVKRRPTIHKIADLLFAEKLTSPSP
jgi:hypothetical protein